ncbi:hypothetical protein EXIGLDRAFT_750351 [Exidia glandulosa HHB12029]|uniref:Extracellular membrane protein CFEM domain-containing protein n=1 Tax=Exidia glandulosa HHB12029 TaxID=1314781 RepID=A0A165GUH7_EXIGL|nr:hypothetical protein EXIGLDRAFT_750351 [Exidia glandulosa HHB12029]
MRFVHSTVTVAVPLFFLATSVLGADIVANDTGVYVTSEPSNCLGDCTFAILDISQSIADKFASCEITLLGNDINSTSVAKANNDTQACFCNSKEIMDPLQSCMRTICPANLTNQLRDYCGPNFKIDVTGNASAKAGKLGIVISMGLGAVALVGSFV